MDKGQNGRYRVHALMYSSAVLGMPKLIGRYYIALLSLKDLLWFCTSITPIIIAAC